MSRTAAMSSSLDYDNENILPTILFLTVYLVAFNSIEISNLNDSFVPKSGTREECQFVTSISLMNGELLQVAEN